MGWARVRAHGPWPIGPWALAHWARVRPGPGPMGPCPLAGPGSGPGPWAHGPLPIGPGSGPDPGPRGLAHWARAQAHGPLPIGPMGPGPLGPHYLEKKMQIIMFLVSQISHFQKVREWLPLVWKLLGYLVVVFWSYLGPPNSHIIKNLKIEPTNKKMAQSPPHSYPHTWGAM